MGGSSVTETLATILDQRVMQPVVIVARSDSQILYINERAAEYFGISKEQARQCYATDFWKEPGRRQLFLKAIDEAGEVADFETQLVTGRGGIMDVLLSSRFVDFDNRQAICSVFTDISQRKRMERELLEQEAKYQELYSMIRRMADTIPDMLWAKDLENRYIFANPVIKRELLCCSEDEDVLGKDDLYYADRQRRRGFEHTFGETCVNSDEVVKARCEPGRFLEDGKVRGKYLVLDVHKAPLFNQAGELIGTVGSGRDVTRDMVTRHELEKSQELFRLLAENVSDVLWVTDESFTPTYVSPSIESLAGYSPAEFRRIPVENHMTSQFKKKFLALKRWLGSRNRKYPESSTSRFFEFECFKKDGSVFWVEIMMSMIRDVDGSLKGYAGVIRDSTRRVEIQKQLSRAREEALAASQTKSEFLANMSHEIRTPLNGVLGLLQLLRDTRLDTHQRKFVETAISSGKSLLSIISDILDFSKIEAGKIVLEEAPCSLRPLVENVVGAFHSMVDREQVKLASRIGAEVPAAIVTDGSRLKQILFNLVGNAVKFTSCGEIAVEVTLHKLLDSQSSVLRFMVRDTGIGIPEAVAPRLFEPFVQQDNSFRRKHGGTGLGLSIVKQLVSIMDGTVALSSSPGKGTVVSVFLPVKHISEEWSGGIGDRPQQWELPRLNILVVEDESINAMVITTMLKRLGQDVVRAENGREALSKLSEQWFDLVLMDVQMPELDGMETTMRIRRGEAGQQRDVPVIALTAHATENDRKRCYDAGMNGYLTKPVEFNRLAQTLLDFVKTNTTLGLTERRGDT